MICIIDIMIKNYRFRCLILPLLLHLLKVPFAENLELYVLPFKRGVCQNIAFALFAYCQEFYLSGRYLNYAM